MFWNLLDTAVFYFILFIFYEISQIWNTYMCIYSCLKSGILVPDVCPWGLERVAFIDVIIKHLLYLTLGITISLGPCAKYVKVLPMWAFHNCYTRDWTREYLELACFPFWIIDFLRALFSSILKLHDSFFFTSHLNGAADKIWKAAQFIYMTVFWLLSVFIAFNHQYSFKPLVCAICTICYSLIYFSSDQHNYWTTCGHTYVPVCLFVCLSLCFCVYICISLTLYLSVYLHI